MLLGGGKLPRNTVLPSPCPLSWGLRPYPLSSSRIDFAFSVVIVIITHLNNFLGKKRKKPSDHQASTVHSKFPAHSCRYVFT